MSSANRQGCDSDDILCSSLISLSTRSDSSEISEPHSSRSSIMQSRKSVRFNEQIDIFIIPSRKDQYELSNDKTVTFCEMVLVTPIPPRNKLADIFQDLWYTREDIEIFALKYGLQFFNKNIPKSYEELHYII